MAPLSWRQDAATRVLIPRSWYADLGINNLEPRSWSHDLGAKNVEPRFWYQQLGTKSVVQDLVVEFRVICQLCSVISCYIVSLGFASISSVPCPVNTHRVHVSVPCGGHPGSTLHICYSREHGEDLPGDWLQQAAAMGNYRGRLRGLRSHEAANYV